MLEIGLLIATLVYACTLPGRIQRLKSRNIPAKHAADPARYEKRVRSESMVLFVCSIVWAAKNLIEVLFLRDAAAAGGEMAIGWVLILAWAGLAIGMHVVRRPLAA